VTCPVLLNILHNANLIIFYQRGQGRLQRIKQNRNETSIGLSFTLTLFTGKRQRFFHMHRLLIPTKIFLYCMQQRRAPI